MYCDATSPPIGVAVVDSIDSVSTQCLAGWGRRPADEGVGAALSLAKCRCLLGSAQNDGHLSKH